MPKQKWSLNTIYISERLQESLRPISRCRMTTVVAPMGYGKTTAVSWFLEQRSKTEAVRIIRISVYSGNLMIFWKSVQDAFARAGLDFLRDYACPTDAVGGGILADGLCHELAGKTPCYIFIDDFHLLTDDRACAFLCTLSERGSLPDRDSDIYSMFIAAMIDPLPKKQRELLAVMGLADEFTAEMARFVTDNGDAQELLDLLTAQNAFVKCLPDGVTYRFHHMMKQCAERTFLLLPKQKKELYWHRFGSWYESRRQYLHAMSSYRKCGDFDALLRVVRKDAGILLSSLDPQRVLSGIEDCPVDVLKAHPLSILVLMRSMFNWRRIPKMLELKALLLSAIDDNGELSEAERGNLLGECDLIMSFLSYNDISAMSRLHRSASAQMSRIAISIHKSGGWTFGSPSVLMMFHRAPGKMQSELADMDECMPHYYKITDGHGQGAEKIMRAEAAFAQGRFTDAHIELESAYARIEGNGQENMALCCDFLAWRLSLCTDVEMRYSFEQRREQLLRQHNAAWLNILDAASAYYHALLGKTERIPEVFSAHRLSLISILAPGKPMAEMIENQVLLAQGAYAKVIGRSEGQLAVCEAMHYALVALHVRLQTAAAYEALGKRAEACRLLDQALKDAAPDWIMIPFVENYAYIKPTLQYCSGQPELIGSIVRLGEAMLARKKAAPDAGSRPAEFAALTDREYEIASLTLRRLSNREIAEKLFLSEGSVKQYISLSRNPAAETGFLVHLTGGTGKTKG